MATKRRKVEVYRLTISGLKDGTDYSKFLQQVRSQFDEAVDAVHQTGKKCHCLDDIRISRGRSRFCFYSYSEGDRPEVINTTDLTISPNPLEDDETFVDWTHVLGSEINGRYVLVIERVQTGIWPSRIEEYFQWMIDKQSSSEKIGKYIAEEEVTVSIEIEPDEAFMKKVLAMDRITSAMVRIVRPNPGWKDLKKELGGEADESDAHYAEVKMNARRSGSLDKKKGLIKAMKEMDSNKQLGRAVVEGKIDDETEVLSSERTSKHKYKYLPTDAVGNVVRDKAFEKLGDYFDTLS